MLNNLLDTRVRANPTFDLVRYDTMSDAARESLANFRNDPSFYGVLRPNEGSDLHWIAVCRDTARLFEHVRSEAARPSSWRVAVGAAENAEVARLVLDGILEVESDTGFLHGAAANDLVFAPPPADDNATEPSLSVAALRHVDQLGLDDAQAIAIALYAYNREPVSPRLVHRLADAAAVERFLGVDQGGPLRRRLDAHWRPSRDGSDGYWLGWNHRRGRRRHRRGRAYKLYVSPRLDALRETFAACLDALAKHRVPSVKIGANAAGLVRSDKLVAYPESFAQLEAVAGALTDRLEGVAVQGVPFTAQLGVDGLLSWGVDPVSCWRPSWQEQESWRLWLAQQLGAAMLHARQAADDRTVPWRYALRRLRLEGIDTETWVLDEPAQPAPTRDGA